MKFDLLKSKSLSASCMLLMQMIALPPQHFAYAEVANCPQCDAAGASFYGSHTPREEQAVPYTEGIPQVTLPIGENLLARVRADHPTLPGVTNVTIPRGVANDPSYLLTNLSQIGFANFPSMEALAQAQQTQMAALNSDNALLNLQRSLYPTTLTGLPNGWNWAPTTTLGFIQAPTGWSAPSNWNTNNPAGVWPTLNFPTN